MFDVSKELIQDYNIIKSFICEHLSKKLRSVIIYLVIAGIANKINEHPRTQLHDLQETVESGVLR